LHVALTWIYLSWPSVTLESYTGRDPIIYYQLEWLNSATNVWEILTSEGTTINYSFNFTSTTVFPSKSTQVFRLRGKNGVGFGVPSPDFPVTTDSEPIFANIPVNTTIVEPKRIELRWDPAVSFTETGGDPVKSY
jgi:hypothetical protein